MAAGWSAPAQAAWTNPASLSDNISPDGQDVTNDFAAIDDNGDAIIVWVQSDGANKQCFKSEYRNGVWTNPSGLSDNISPSGQDVEGAKVAMDGNGNAIIVWQQSNGTNTQIFKAEYRNGAWTSPSGLSDNISPDGQDATYPWVAMDDNGDALIVWTQSDGANVQIFKAEYRNGAWSYPSGLSDNISIDGTHCYSQVMASMSNNTDALIAWTQNDGAADAQVFIAEYRNDAWTYPTGLSDNLSPDGEDAGYVDTAIDRNGNAIVTWSQSDGANTLVYKSEYRNGAWSNPASLSDPISPGGQNALAPDTAMSSGGDALITWWQNDGANTQIFIAHYNDGAWTYPSSLSDNISPDGQDASAMDVGMDDYNNGIIIWTQSNGSNEMAFASVYHDGAWSNPASLNDYLSPAGQDASNARIAVNGGFNAVASWVQSDGANAQTFKSEYLSYLLTVNSSGAGTGAVTSSPGEISTSGGFSAYPCDPGDVMTLSANPDSGSYFWGWSGGECSGKGDCILTMNAATTLTAEFALSAPAMGAAGTLLLGAGLLGAGLWMRSAKRRRKR